MGSVKQNKAFVKTYEFTGSCARDKISALWRLRRDLSANSQFGRGIEIASLLATMMMRCMTSPNSGRPKP
jgi:hypothetical protein